MKYVSFLRGINVGGHHKVPMMELRSSLEELGFGNVTTLLNSGNIVFDAATNDSGYLEEKIEELLGKQFGFPVPTIVRKAQTIIQLFDEDPFKNVKVTKDIRLYISFLKKEHSALIKLPWTSVDQSYKILAERDRAVLSVLDLSVAKTPNAMDALEKYFGHGITTRNWNTIIRIVSKLG